MASATSGAGAAVRDKTRKKRKLKTEPKSHEQSGHEFELSLDSLQGCWQHSSVNLGILSVRGTAVKFDSGLAFTVVVQADGTLEMAGWLASREKSSAEEIVWTKGALSCAWYLEGDADECYGSAEAVDVRNIVQGKRQRGAVDYRALALELPPERPYRAAVRSDASESEEEEGEDEGVPPQRTKARESSHPRGPHQAHTRNVAEAAELFKKWVLSTCTAKQEERLQRRGCLSTMLPVCFTGVGRGLIEKELQRYGARVVHKAEGLLVSVDAAARSLFRERHADLWHAASSAQAPPQRSTGLSASNGAELGARSARAGVAHHALEMATSAASPGAAGAGCTTTPSVDKESVQRKRGRRLRAIAMSDGSDADASNKASTVGVARARTTEAVVAPTVDSVGSRRPEVLAHTTKASCIMESAGVATTAQFQPAVSGPVTTKASLASQSVVAAVSNETPDLKQPEAEVNSSPAVADDDGTRGCDALPAAWAHAWAAASAGGAGSGTELAATGTIEGNEVGMELAPARAPEDPAVAPPQLCPPPAEPDVARPRTDEVAAQPPAKAPEEHGTPPEPPLSAAAPQGAAEPPHHHAASDRPRPVTPDLAPPANSTPESKANSPETPEIQGARGELPGSLKEAQSLLEANPLGSQAAALLAYLSEQPIDATVLEQTKIGATLNKLKKQYQKGGRRDLAAACTELVERWRQVWQAARLKAPAA